jgi:Holliday junction resolvasome RuvABC endonuclease subunit
LILALDISLNTGYAMGAGENITFGSRCFRNYSSDCAMLARAFGSWLSKTIEENEFTSVAIERPFFSPKTAKSGYLLNGLSWEAHKVAHYHDLPRADYSPMTVKKFITGKGNSKKPEVMAAVRALGYKIRDDNQADAVAILLLHERNLAAIRQI